MRREEAKIQTPKRAGIKRRLVGAAAGVVLAGMLGAHAFEHVASPAEVAKRQEIARQLEAMERSRVYVVKTYPRGKWGSAEDLEWGQAVQKHLTPQYVYLRQLEGELARIPKPPVKPPVELAGAGALIGAALAGRKKRKA